MYSIHMPSSCCLASHRIRSFPSTVTYKKRKAIRITGMRAVVQRVSSASVEVHFFLSTPPNKSQSSYSSSSYSLNISIYRCYQVEGRVVSEIGAGLLVLVGLHDSDTDSDADYMYSRLSLLFPPFLS